ncbi:MULTISPECIES: hypothetical protein [Microcystis]|uniref:hypothetical protein n=1 Tax=Microcystis TaxID=1125 RepID=UPI001680E29F|nr:hypothetical protein [Microcystis wesenbergii]MBD2118232.1 hypothetical protein [Microcystis wesenbergii FACHB-1339]
MNLPLINTDNVGNSYYGWRTNNLIYAPDSLGFTADKWQNWINGFFGQTCVDSNFNLILPVPFETLSLPVASNRWRFTSTAINTTNTTGIPAIQMIVQGGSQSLANSQAINSTTRVHYGVLNNSSFSMFSIRTEGANINNVEFSFASIGWLRNPLYSGSAFPRNAYYLFNVANNNNASGSGRPSAENTTVLQRLQYPNVNIADPIANYSINCQTATPGANATELYLRDNVAPHKAIGYVPNLLKTSLQIPVGQVYRNTGIDPDGSNMNTWICVGVFGSERILMRVWAQGLN